MDNVNKVLFLLLGMDWNCLKDVLGSYRQKT